MKIKGLKPKLFSDTPIYSAPNDGYFATTRQQDMLCVDVKQFPSSQEIDYNEYGDLFDYYNGSHFYSIFENDRFEFGSKMRVPLKIYEYPDLAPNGASIKDLLKEELYFARWGDNQIVILTPIPPLHVPSHVMTYNIRAQQWVQYDINSHFEPCYVEFYTPVDQLVFSNYLE